MFEVKSYQIADSMAQGLSSSPTYSNSYSGDNNSSTKWFWVILLILGSVFTWFWYKKKNSENLETESKKIIIDKNQKGLEIKSKL
jgi:hypothetical protein